MPRNERQARSKLINHHSYDHLVTLAGNRGSVPFVIKQYLTRDQQSIEDVVQARSYVLLLPRESTALSGFKFNLRMIDRIESNLCNTADLQGSMIA
jgi:hypothetical protein